MGSPAIATELPTTITQMEWDQQQQQPEWEQQQQLEQEQIKELQQQQLFSMKQHCYFCTEQEQQQQLLHGENARALFLPI